MPNRKAYPLNTIYTEFEDLNSNDCIPARRRIISKRGEVYNQNESRTARAEARKVLIQISGEPPFEGAVCRHLCENDSTMPNGFVCVRHTEWATQSENMQDASQKMSASAKRRCERDGVEHLKKAGLLGAEARWGIVS